MLRNKFLIFAAAEAAASAGGVAVSASPLAKDITAQVSTNLVEMKEVAFHFRKDKEFGNDSKRPTLKMNLPLLTKAGVLAAMTADDKSTALVIDLANEAIINRQRGLIAEKIEDDKFDKEAKKWSTELKPEMFDVNALSFLTIANLPKSERGSGISKEQWAEFVKDYKEVMTTPAAIAKLPDQKARSTEILDKHGAILQGKFNAVRSRKDVIRQMLSFIDVWVQVSPNAEDHVECYEHLKAKGEQLLTAENFDDL